MVTRTTRESATKERPSRRKPGPKPGTPEARRGGLAAKAKYGREFYAQIGRIGGAEVKRAHGSEFYSDIGRRGGVTTKTRHGSEHYQRIGKIGGKNAHRGSAKRGVTNEEG